MRILWLCATPALGADLLRASSPMGGGWTAALEAALVRHRDVELSVAFPWQGASPERLERDGHEYLPFPAYPRGSRLRRLLVDASCRLEPASECRHLERAVEIGRPDLIHVWGTEAYFGLVAERTDLPVLIELQGLRNPYTAAYCSGLTKLDLLRHGSPGRLLKGRSMLHGFYRYRRTAERERRILAAARYVSGRTEWDRLVSGVLAPEARYFHVDRVLRPEFYEARWRRRPPGGALRLVSTLRGNAYKGIEVIAACARLLRRRHAEGLRWTLVGIRPGEEVHRLVERKLGLSFEALGIRLVGRQPAGEVVRHLCESDLFVLPSRIENSPNGLCEAMLLGMPVVSTNVGGVPSLLESGGEGLLVPAGDPWAMAGAVLRLAGDSDLGARLGTAARRRALRRHDPATVAAAVVGVYAELLRDRPAARG